MNLYIKKGFVITTLNLTNSILISHSEYSFSVSSANNNHLHLLTYCYVPGNIYLNLRTALDM